MQDLVGIVAVSYLCNI